MSKISQMPVADAVTGDEYVEVLQNGANKRVVLRDLGNMGPAGPVGYSAYEVAVQNGFQGNEAAWMTSLRGIQGVQGSQGIPGSNGATGAKGDMGDQGIQGPAGTNGVDGRSAYEVAVAQGFVGNQAQWLLSLKGQTGEQGLQGSQGIQGDAGTPGATGANGTNGVDGRDAYQVALAAGFVGNQAAWLLSLIGATGDTGPQGIQGIQGLKGDKGDTGEPGLNGGADGISAYQVAVDNGFVGTITDWLASLHGSTGPQGPQGSIGLTGPQGEQGPQGVEGDSAYQVATATGFVGTQIQWLASLVGATGATGSQGIQGPAGAQGIQGVKGDTGDTGATGATGIQGIQGPIGATGDTGPQGPAGTNGTNGTSGSDGQSAYQVALSAGFVGTQAAWLASLVGTQGPAGATGAAGGILPENKASTIDAQTGTDDAKYMTALAVFTAIAERAGRVFLPPPCSSTIFQAANDALRNAGGGSIELVGGRGAYVFATGLIIDTGAGVSVFGNSAILDFRTLPDEEQAITLASRVRSPDNFPIAGYDAATSNYHGTRATLSNFSMIGPGRNSATDGIDVHQPTSSAGGRSPRPGLIGVVIQAFRRGFRHRRVAYGVTCQRVAIFNCDICLSLEGSTDGTDDDSGENSLIDHCFLFNSRLCVDFNTGTNDYAITFRNVSFDYSVQLLKLTSGYGRVHFYECHFEHRDNSSVYPIDFTAGTGSGVSRGHFRFDGGLFVHAGVTSVTATVTTTAGSATVTVSSSASFAVGSVISGNANIPPGTTVQAINGVNSITLSTGVGVTAASSVTTTFSVIGRGYPSYIGIGPNVRVQLTGSTTLHNLLSQVGFVLAAGKGAGGTDISTQYFARCTDPTGVFELNGGALQFIQNANASLPAALSNSSKVCLLGDPTFEQTFIADAWADTSTTPGSTIGTLITTTADPLTGTRCLGVPLIGGAGGSRKLSLLVPMEKLRGRNFGFQFWAKFLPGGTSAIKPGGNTGNGTLTMDATTNTLVGVQVGVYTVRLTTAAVNGGTFTVTDPAGTVLGTVVVGATFSNQIKFSTSDGAADFVVGDGFNITVNAPVNSAYLDILPVIARKTGATTWAIDQQGTAIFASAATITGMDWTACYLNSLSARLSCPEWATHISFRFNMDSVATPGGKMLIDEFMATVY